MNVQVARDYAAVTTAKYIGRLRHRHDLARSADDHRRPALRSPGRRRSAPRRCPASPDSAAAGAQRAGGAGVFKWNNVTPRVGITYAVDEARKTVVRASYAMFASQLPGDAAKFVSPIQYPYAYYNARRSQRRRHRAAQRAAVQPGPEGLLRLRPDQPDAPVDGQHRRPERQGADHARVPGRHRQGDVPNFSVSATFTYRKMVDLIWDPLTGVKPSDYTQTGTLTGTIPELGAYNVPLYALNASAVPPGGG